MEAQMTDADIARHELMLARNESRQLFAMNNGTPSHDWHERDRRALDILLRKIARYSAIVDADVESRR